MISFLFARSIRFCSILLLLIACACLCARAQDSPDHPIPMVPGSQAIASPGAAIGNPNALGSDQSHMLHNMMKERNVLRQKEIVDDTDRLVELSKQLKDAVDKSNKDQLSLAVINTASEMEKLAKAVKEKMRDGE